MVGARNRVGWRRERAEEKDIAVIGGMDVFMPRSKANKWIRHWGNAFALIWVLSKLSAMWHTVEVYKGVWWNLP